MRFVPELPAQFQTKNSSKSAKAQYMKTLKNGGKKLGDQSAEERYQEILKEKMDEVRNEALKGASYSFQLDGTDSSECRTLSKGAQEVLAKIAEKKAKQAAKKAKKADIISITPKSFTGMQGGRIDGRGRIFDSAGQHIMSVDKKTGKIKNERTGCTLGKYKGGCGYSEHRITELIGQYDTTTQAGWWAGSDGHNGTIGEMGWGTTSASNSIWGDNSAPSTGGTDVWGNKTDDNNGWW